jgi:tRNA (adenine22-N1)-methyltransferase
MIAAPPARPRLSLRLRILRDLLPPGHVADVGAGHGALAAHLAAAGRRVIAIEALPAPLAELRANLDAWGLADRIQTRLGRGLEALQPGEVTGAIIAGLGGRTLLEIVGTAPDRGLQWVAMQCVQRAALLDAWVDKATSEAGWRTLEERLIEERGRAYHTWILAVGGPVG